MDLRDAELSRAWIAAGLQAVRIPGDFETASHWLRIAGVECTALPPVGVVIDLVGLLARDERPTDRPAPPVLDAVLRRYVDQVLGRIAVHPRRQDLHDALERLEPELRPVALGLFVEAWLQRLDVEPIVLAPEAIDDLEKQDASAWALRGAAALRGEVGEQLQHGYEALIEAFGRAREAITAAEVTLVERLSELRGRADRLALVQIVESSAALRRDLPRVVRVGRRHQGHVPTITEDESNYPVGGFTSITTRGSFENLVPSELAGMEDGDEIDLFDVRYAENELLYYTRDESSFHRRYRNVFIVLDQGIDRLRHRDRALPWQTRILAFGLVHALVHQLARWLSTFSLSVTVVWPERGLEEDERILGVALQQQLEAGWLRFTRSFEPAVMQEAGRRAPTDVVSLVCHDRPVEGVEHTWRTVVRIGSELAVEHPGGPAVLAGEPWDRWRAGFDALARDLV